MVSTPRHSPIAVATTPPTVERHMEFTLIESCMQQKGDVRPPVLALHDILETSNSLPRGSTSYSTQVISLASALATGEPAPSMPLEQVHAADADEDEQWTLSKLAGR